MCLKYVLEILNLGIIKNEKDLSIAECIMSELHVPVHFLFYMDGNKGLLSSVSISVSLNSITISSTDPRSV